MGIPLLQKLFVGSYVIRQRLAGRKRYPLVLMLEPLFRCNLACAGCGKIDYPDPILHQNMSVADALHAVDECRAPVVSVRRRRTFAAQTVAGNCARHHRTEKIRLPVHQCTSDGQEAIAIRAEYLFTWSVHLDGDREMHDHSVCQPGTYDRAVAAIKHAKERGFRVNINCTLFNTAQADRVAAFFDTVTELGVDGITVSPGYAYERAPDQQHFLNRGKTKQLFRDVFKRGPGRTKWSFSQSSLFLDFLAGNQSYHCTPWGNPTRTIFGWQKPCYLLGEGYAKTFQELMTETDWDAYGTGNYEKCADCMVHSGYEASAVQDAVAQPLKALGVSLRGVRTDGTMTPEIALDRQRPAQYVFSKHVEHKLEEIRQARAKSKWLQRNNCGRSIRARLWMEPAA